ncbi:hypothetical protein D9M72_562830 [compost metagenome]
MLQDLPVFNCSQRSNGRHGDVVRPGHPNQMSSLGFGKRQAKGSPCCGGHGNLFCPCRGTLSPAGSPLYRSASLSILVGKSTS